MLVFFFNDTATTEIYTLSLHDALPICAPLRRGLRHLGQPLGVVAGHVGRDSLRRRRRTDRRRDRKSTRLNSSHANISYAVFCLKKKKIITSHISSTHETASWQECRRRH